MFQFYCIELSTQRLQISDLLNILADHFSLYCLHTCHAKWMLILAYASWRGQQHAQRWRRCRITTSTTTTFIITISFSRYFVRGFACFLLGETLQFSKGQCLALIHFLLFCLLLSCQPCIFLLSKTLIFSKFFYAMLHDSI